MTDTATRAAIRRASQQARNAMRELDVAGIDQLLGIYEDAADQVRAAIRAAAASDDSVSLAQLRPLLRQVEDVLANMGTRRDQLLASQIELAAALGTRPYTAAGVQATGRAGQALLDSAAAMRINEDAVAFVRSFQAADGLTLSDRLWRLDQGAKEVLSRAIGQAVVQGWDASRAAAQAAYNGLPVPRDVQARARAGRADELVNLADLLVGEDGAEVWKAERVFRTEINRAHGEAYMAGGEKAAGFAGWRFLLSPAHPRPDICDLLAAQNLHGLGAGVYPSREETPWPAHPNTLSFLVIVFEDEITEADRAGKQTSLEALAGLSAEQRAGALGVAKAAYFDRGLLTRGMIRAPLGAVERRIERNAAGAGKLHPAALPGARDAFIPDAKITGYALNVDHGVGGNKARVFASALGIGRDNAEVLTSQIRAGVLRYPAIDKGLGQHGRLFQVDIPVTGPTGTAMVRTGWIVRNGETMPRLTSAYVKDKGK